MFDSIKKIFHKRSLGSLELKVQEVNALEPEIAKLGDEEIKTESLKLKERVGKGESLDDVLPRAFALARETAKRTLGQRPFDVQLLGGLVLHQGAVAEMMTGKGKTLAPGAPAYFKSAPCQGGALGT